MSLRIKLQRLSIYAQIPTKGTEGSAYYDLYSAEKAVVEAGQICAISTGWNIEVPKGYFLDIRSRSGLSLKGLILNNAPATIDADYRGELKMIMYYEYQPNCLLEYKIDIGDRLAQCALMPVSYTTFIEVKQLTTTIRGRSGYGSTGR